MKNPVPRTAAIHDLSGFGRTSLSVVIPILSCMGVQPCSLPTAVLSTHTGGFHNYRFVDLTDQMQSIIDHWKEIGIHFDAVYSGFLGSSRQIDIVREFIGDFSCKDQLILIDPVLGDNGKPYSTMDASMIAQMRELVKHADVITPNFTEASFLLGEPYDPSISLEELKVWTKRLADKGPGKVIITSVPVPQGKHVSSVLAYNAREDRLWKVDCSYIPAHYPGTGDIFASVIVGSLLQGDSLPIALDRAVQFVSLAIRSTFGYDFPAREGVLLERVLPSLNGPVMASSYQILE
ncbi:pyridoxamine kinase [Desulfoplanes formicivorans]|uniref:pyridoxal kinase n=1 Tax=Desulfoplanes formicivorans TaxID=1592317 RepID=A0A194AED5_9BACT|nr:pyridoxamine kinase [Desulfoplanes formicivorans]GAU07481.1 pyridoxamine kinase [Desulfoplanes formicivorans]